MFPSLSQATNSSSISSRRILFETMKKTILFLFLLIHTSVAIASFPRGFSKAKVVEQDPSDDTGSAVMEEGQGRDEDSLPEVEGPDVILLKFFLF